MRIFQRLGVALEIELLAQTGLTYEFLSADLKALQRIKTGEDGSAWKKDYLCSSVDIETIVDSSARELGVQVLKGMTVDSFQDHGKYATITFHPTADSMAEISTIEAAIVIGADGANSFIREVIGSNRLDQGFAPWDNLVVDFEHNDLDRDFPKLKQNYQILDIKRPQLAGRWGGRGRSRFEFARIDGESRKDFLEENTVWSLLSKWEITSKDAKLIRCAIYTFKSYFTDEWRKGRLSW
jgi:2-polyprenyl-6-methoxyphenol hydroxylase-like FAD-dependent oxidoreductase